MLDRAVMGLCAHLPRGGFTVAKFARQLMPSLGNYPIRPKCANMELRGDVSQNVFYPLAIHGYYSHQAVEDDLLAMLARDANTIIDVGANIGYTAALLASHSQPSASIRAYEPLPLCQPYLEQVVAQFPKIEVVQKALGDRLGTAEFLQRKNIDRSSFTGKGDAPVTNTITVDITTIDKDYNDVDPDLIKIDVEGFEPAVLRGAVETISRSKPIVVFEAYEREVLDFSTAFFTDLDAGYKLFVINSGGTLRPLDVALGEDPDTCNFVAWPDARNVPADLSIPRSYER